MALQRGVLTIIVALWLLFSGCSVGYSHTSDEKLERNFLEHESEFEALLRDVRSDPKITTLQPDLLIYDNRRVEVVASNPSAIDGTGLSRSRWNSYVQTFHDLGLAGGLLRDRHHIEFRVDKGSVRNGDSHKGYEYDQDRPSHVRSSLDSYRVADADRDEFGNWIARKHIKGNWYLYLFVNR
jgi:hypothetical protein